MNLCVNMDEIYRDSVSRLSLFSIGRTCHAFAWSVILNLQKDELGDEDMNGKFTDRLFIGLIIIGVGVVFLLNQLGYDISIGYVFSNYWPVILIGFGVSDLLKIPSKGSSGFWGLLWIAFGVIFLGRNLDWFTWGIGDIFSTFWPVIIIIVGASMIFKPKRKRKEKPPGEDWEAYNSQSFDADVPPAPPLHPDPTRPPLFDNDTEQVNTGKKTAAKDEWQKANNAQNHQHQQKQHSQHEERQGYHYNHSSSHHKKKEYVEWWNHGNSETQTRSGFIGDIHIGEDYWELKPLNISHFIGDTVLDLTKAHVEYGETRITISSFIGDVKVYVPNDYEIGVQVQSSAFIGDVKVLGRKEGGLFNNVNLQSPTYSETDKKIKLIVSTFIGDVKVTKVG